MDSRARQLPTVHGPLTAVCPEANYLASLCFCFPAWKVGVLVPASPCALIYTICHGSCHAITPLSLNIVAQPFFSGQ